MRRTLEDDDFSSGLSKLFAGDSDLARDERAIDKLSNQFARVKTYLHCKNIYIILKKKKYVYIYIIMVCIRLSRKFSMRVRVFASSINIGIRKS